MPRSDPSPAASSGEGPPPGRPRPVPGGPPGTVVLTLPGTVARGEVPALCARMRSLLERGEGTGGVPGHDGPSPVVLCDAGAVTRPDLATVEALARLRLTARRLGCRLRLRNAGPELRALLHLLGLDAVLGARGAAAGAEPWGQAEEGEEVRGVEEGVEPGDAAV
ncbi:STAS domain-containing protein [Streptomyces sp. SID5475]|nr:STAS domain-containing protein [Streptomyces sp. SID5475]